MQIVAVVSDLIFESKVSGTAAAVGVRVRVVRSTAAALAAISAGDAAALIVDLTVAAGDPLALIRDASGAAPGLPILAFFPHVQAELGRAARAAGARTVVRSKFTENLADILRELARPPG